MTQLVEIIVRWHGQIQALERFDDVKTLRLGGSSNHAITLNHPEIPADGLPLLEHENEKYAVVRAPWMKLMLNGVRVDDSRVPMRLDDEVVLELDPFCVEIRVVDSELGKVPFFEGFDKRYGVILAALFALQLGLLVGISLTPPVENQTDEIFRDPNRFRKVIARQIQKQQRASSLKAASAKAGDEGKAGSMDEKVPKVSVPKKGSPTIQMSEKERNQLAAANALKKLGLASSSTTYGAGGVGQGLQRVFSGLQGTSQGMGAGVGGASTRGTGVGGGGSAITVGGVGSGKGTGVGGAGDVELGGGGRDRVRVQPGTVTYEGSLTREEIQRVIDKALPQIRYCYEREMQKHPELEGKLMLSWVIIADGSVDAVSGVQNTLNQSVESCVSRVVQRLQFPNPRGGGIVRVSYPFNFSVAGA